jgi:hypothetical protein
MRVRWFGSCLLAALFVVAGPAGATLAAPAPESSGGIGVRIVDAPVATQGDPRARSYIVDHLAPGTVINRRIEVSNTTGSAANVSLYAAAADIINGSFQGAEGHTANELSTWATVSPGSPGVPAGGTKTATVTITVPADAAPGERYGVIWAEVASAPADGGGVVQVGRVGIRMYLSVGPGGAPAADFVIDTLTASRSADGQPTVLATVRNTGGRALDVSGTLDLADGPGGLSAGPFDAALGTTLAIGDTAPVSIGLDDQLPDGPWEATITLRSGLVERSAQASITFPDTGAADPVAVESAGHGWFYPAGIGAAAILGTAGTGLFAHRRRRRPAGDLVPALDTVPNGADKLVGTPER